ncbi:MAG: hypothetical protein WBZ40_11015 [Acidimicrobiia bacterium]
MGKATVVVVGEVVVVPGAVVVVAKVLEVLLLVVVLAGAVVVEVASPKPEPHAAVVMASKTSSAHATFMTGLFTGYVPRMTRFRWRW